MIQPTIGELKAPVQEMDTDAVAKSADETTPDSVAATTDSTSDVSEDQPLPMDASEFENDVESEPLTNEAPTPVVEAPKTISRPAFIPPQPVRPGNVSNSQTSAEPFAAAAMDNAVSEPPMLKRRPPTLFERMTGAGRARVQREEPQPVKTETKADSASTPAQPSLDGLDPHDRVEPSSADADLLEIPAFLRRQAN
jgi:cell division protein FtsZ